MFWGAHLAPSLPLSAAFPSIPGLSQRKGGRAWFTDAAASLWTESSPGTAQRGWPRYASLSLSPPDVRLLFRGWGRAALTQGRLQTGRGESAWRAGLMVGGGAALSFIRSAETIRGLSPGYGGACGGRPGWERAERKQAQVCRKCGTLGQGRKHLCLGRSGPAGAGAQTGGVSGGLEARLRSLGPDGVQEGDPRWVQVPMPCLQADLGEPLPYQPCPPEKRPGLREGGWREGSALKVGCLGVLQFHLPLKLAGEASRRWVRPLCVVCGGPLTSWCRQRPRCLQAVGRPP